MDLNDPCVLPLLELYRKHSGFFYVNHFRNFKLFASWLLDTELGTIPVVATKQEDAMPWFAGSYELQELAKFLRVPQGRLFKFLMEHYNDTQR
jgi:hypothetical protein